MYFKYVEGDLIDDNILNIDVEVDGRLYQLVYCDFEQDGCWQFVEFGAVIDFDISPYFKEEDYEEDVYMTIFNRDQVEGAIEVGEKERKEKMKEFMKKINMPFTRLTNLADHVFHCKETKEIFKEDYIERENFFFPH